MLAPLWKIPGIVFISLQKGQGEEEAATPPDDQPILDLGREIHDFADTAALIVQLDLLICVDTSLAHLAGALQKPCWVMLPTKGVDWRWLQEREDSPWYPEVLRLFRRELDEDWPLAVKRLTLAVELWSKQTQPLAEIERSHKKSGLASKLKDFFRRS
jgi:ADP-heptose:LPS heptosyltransferase